MAKLTTEQQTILEQWASEGATLNEIQQRLASQFEIKLSYLDARLLMLDLNVKIKDKEKPKEPEPAAVPVVAPGGVKVTLDELAITGAMCSGSATFSDGVTAGWYIDQGGRLGLRAADPAYQPPAADVPVFQEELDRLLVQAGL